ncbi:MAG: PadR family transcriptional regulator [Chloroflexota bacterium]|nr:PadR family transcriptional regulator [Chloroflexota bacterium]
MQDVVLAMVIQEPAHGYELHQRLATVLGSLGEELNPGQVYVTLSRLERAGFLRLSDAEEQSRTEKKVYEATAAARPRVLEWLTDRTWPKVSPLDFHLKLVAAVTTRLADPLVLVDAQRRELMRRLSQLQRAALDEAQESISGLLLEGAIMRLEADISWLELCEQRWQKRVVR